MDVPSALVDRIRGEFLEMPGLKLTVGQACRLWNLNEELCRAALAALTKEGFLRETPSGAFISLPSAARMAKATMPEMRTARCAVCQHLNAIPTEAGEPAGTRRCAACGRLLNTAADRAARVRR